LDSGSSQKRWLKQIPAITKKKDRKEMKEELKLSEDV